MPTRRLRKHGSDLVRRLLPWLSHLQRIELRVVASVCLIAGGLWAFVELTDEVLEGETQSADERILLIMRDADDPSDPIGPRWMEELGRDFTALGGMGVLTLITVAAMGYLLLDRKFRAALFVGVAVASGIATSLLLKKLFSRPRPDLVPHESYVYTSSFPSGHSMMSALTYFTLAALLIRLNRPWHVKVYLMLAAGLITLAVGVSRVYMGVHWPTDVLAGWTAGAIWALFCWSVAAWLQRRGQLETADAEPQQQANTTSQ